jgi:hypothetical protein
MDFGAPVPRVDVRIRPEMKDRQPPEAALEDPYPRPGQRPARTESTPAPDRIVYPGEGMILAED